MERFQVTADTLMIATEGKFKIERFGNEILLLVDMSIEEMRQLRNALDYKLQYGKDWQ